MSKKLKIIIASIILLMVLSTEIYFLNKELPSCFSTNFISKIKTEAGCFELVKYDGKEFNSKEQQEYISNRNSYELNNSIESAAKDYYKKVIPLVKDYNMKVIVNLGFLGLGPTDYTSINFYVDSPKLDNLNPELNYETKMDETNKIITELDYIRSLNQPIGQNIKTNLYYFGAEYLIDRSDKSLNYQYVGFYNMSEERNLEKDVQTLINQPRNKNFKLN